MNNTYKYKKRRVQILKKNLKINNFKKYLKIKNLVIRS